MTYDENFDVPLYTTPTRREWVGLTDEQLREALRQCPHDTVEALRVRWLYAKDFARAIEACLKDKNKWLTKWDVKIQCDSREEADRVREALENGDLISRKEAIDICLDYHRAGGTAWDCWNALLPR